MSEDDIGLAWLAAKIHATGGTPDRIAINPDNAHLAPELDIELADPAEAHNFTAGQTYTFERGRLLTGWRLVWWRVRQFARHYTRWWRPRTVCSAIDQELSVVTVAQERWSWRRWRWERVRPAATLDSFDAIIKRHYKP